MICAGCVKHVEHALRTQPGVPEVAMNLASATARLKFDPRRVSLQTLINAVADVGCTYGALGAWLLVSVYRALPQFERV
jgi:copper chaperone CopZ